MAKTSREEILQAALEVFAEKGYEAANLKDIAEKVGIRTPSLYKHFAGKKELYDELTAALREEASREALPEPDIEADAAAFAEKKPAALAEQAQKIIHCSAANARTLKFLSTLSGDMGKDFLLRYEEGQLFDYYKILFAGLTAAGLYEDKGAEYLALAYSAPIGMLCRICEKDPTKEEECLELVEKHVSDFVKSYRIKPDQDKKDKKKSRKKK